MIKKTLSFFCFCFLACKAFAVEPSVLFVLYDAGETNALLPVIQKCENDKISYQVLAFGTACKLVPTFYDAGIELDSNWDRAAPLGQEEIEKIHSMFHPQIVISGVASRIQGQLLEAFRKSAKTYAFWDNFSASGANPYFDVAKEVQKEAEYVLFPSAVVAGAPEFENRPSNEKFIVGHPLFDEWREKIVSIDKEALLNKLHCNPDRILVSYIGSYGPEYEKAYPLFLDYVETLEKAYDFLFRSDHEKANIFVQAHPKTDGSFEKEHSPAHFLINQLSTLEAIAVADMVVCYNSTAGFQALLLGKDLFYFIPTGDPLTNSAIEMGLAKRISSTDDFDQTVNKSRIDAAELLGIPENSVEKIFELIKQ
ncbi:MAG TPA: hypothetical protein VLG76_04695 [Rhabdochlamydiaceae bacterium]|nr:hypothetical protein [Rhabdochlamydiaceae bacterium]